MSRPVKIQFRAKVQTVHDADGAPVYQFVTVPKLTRSHVDMHAARCHSRLGVTANSDFFPSVLAGIFPSPPGRLRLDRLPEGVTVDTSGFLAVVSYEVPA